MEKRYASLLFALVAAGCGDPPATTPMADMAVAAVDLRQPRDLIPPPSGAVKGIIVDEMGKPMAGVLVLCCSAVECPNGVMTASDGTFGQAGLPLRQRMVKVQENAAVNPRLGETIAPVLLTTDGVTVDVGTLYVPIMGKGAAIAASGSTPQVLDAGDGLSVTVIRDDFELALGVKDYNLVARTVPLAHLPKSGFDIPGEKVVGVWALMYFGSRCKTCKTPMALTAQLAAMPGAAVNFRTISDLDGTASMPIAGHAAMDGKSVSTDPGKGMTEVTWLVASAP